MSMMAWGWDVVSFVFGSRIVVRFGWSLARGWRPAEDFRLAWYRFGLFLYMASSFFLSLSMSFRFALLIIIEMALWHREGMSSMLGGSVSWRMFESDMGRCVGCFLFGAWVGGLCVWRMCGWFALGDAAISVIAQFCEAFELSVV